MADKENFRLGQDPDKPSKFVEGVHDGLDSGSLNETDFLENERHQLTQADRFNKIKVVALGVGAITVGLMAYGAVRRRIQRNDNE